jgi:hypothetical protein
VVKAKVVAVLEIRFLDSNNQMTHNNNSHTKVVEEASFKAGEAKEDVVIGTDNNLDQIQKLSSLWQTRPLGQRM